MGYKNHSAEAGVKGEDDYRVAYVKDIHKVKQGFSELTTVNEMGMRSPRDMERILEAGKIVLGTVAVGTFFSFAFPAAVAFLSTFTFGKLIATSALAIGTMITTNQVSDKNKSNYQKKEKDKD